MQKGKAKSECVHSHFPADYEATMFAKGKNHYTHGFISNKRAGERTLAILFDGRTPASSRRSRAYFVLSITITYAANNSTQLI